MPTLVPYARTAVIVTRDGSTWEDFDGVVTLGFNEYVASDLDTSADTKYYGFVKANGNWYIMKEVTSAGSYRFTKGTSDFTTAWTNRATQTYGYYDVIF